MLSMVSCHVAYALLLDLDGSFVGRFAIIVAVLGGRDGSHLVLHLLEVLDELVFALVHYVTHLLTDLLLQGSVTL